MTGSLATMDFLEPENYSFLHKMTVHERVLTTSFTLENRHEYVQEHVSVKPDLKFSIDRILGLNVHMPEQLDSRSLSGTDNLDNERKVHGIFNVGDMDDVDDDTCKDYADTGSSPFCDDSNTPRYHWLQCTRYHPPKLQRNKQKNGTGRRKLGRNPRVPFTQQQVTVLEDKYKTTRYLSSQDVIYLSSTLGLTEARVKIWFQNRRARDRREKEATQMNEKSILKPTFLPLSVPSVSWPSQASVLSSATCIPRVHNPSFRSAYFSSFGV